MARCFGDLHKKRMVITGTGRESTTKISSPTYRNPPHFTYKSQFT